MQTLAFFAATIFVWFALSFLTKTWVNQWITAVAAGLAAAWFRWGNMQEVAAVQTLEPMGPVRFGLIAVGGMLVLASVGMGLHRLLRQMRR